MIFKLCRRCKRTILHPSTYCIKCLDAVNQEREKLKSIRKSKYNKHNELPSWSFSNAKVVANSFGEIKVDKEPGARTKTNRSSRCSNRCTCNLYEIQRRNRCRGRND